MRFRREERSWEGGVKGRKRDKRKERGERGEDKFGGWMKRGDRRERRGENEVKEERNGGGEIRE